MDSQLPTSNKHSDSSAKMWLLYSGIKSLLRSDEAEVVQGIARYVIKQYRSLRIGEEFVERNRDTLIPPIAAFLGAVTRFLEVRENKNGKGVLFVARLANEQRAIEKIISLLPEINWHELKLQRPPTLASVSRLPRKIFPLRRRIFKLVRLLLRDGQPFFKVLRVVEMLGYYAAYLVVFQKGNYQAAIMSSHSNPHGIAFNLAARKCGIPTILVTHGMPVRPVARLFYDLAIIHCEAARQIYLEEGCRFKQIIIHSRRQDYASMPTAPLSDSLNIGIFLCKDVDESRLQRLVEILLESPPVSRLLIRPHPKNLFLGLDDWIAKLSNKRVQKVLSDSVISDLTQTDIVFGGNSSVLIEAVTAGRPGVYVAGLDHGTTDFHGFVANKLIYPFEFETACNFEQIQRFYQRSDWLNILRFYANIDESESLIAERTAAAMRGLISVCK